MPSSHPHRSVPPARAVVVALVAMLVAAAAGALGGSAARALPAPPRKPTIAEVSALLDHLGKQTQVLDERYNAAVAAVAAQAKRAQAARRAARAAGLAAVQAQDRLSSAMAQQYEAGSMNSTGLLLTSADPQSYLDNLGTMDYLSGEMVTMTSQAKAARAQARAASRHAAAELAATQAKARTMRHQRAVLAARTARLEKVLATLTAQQRRAYARAREVAAAQARAQLQQAAPPAPAPSAPSAPQNPPAPPAPSSSVQRVVAFAEAQVGKPYVFGASGPDAFDCSGLTMAAWAQAGVSLPHLASAQYGVGRQISYSELQPGDLIFLYNPIGHVEIYVGHDLAVSAADEALGIIYVHPSQDMADFVGASRPQG